MKTKYSTYKIIKNYFGIFFVALFIVPIVTIAAISLKVKPKDTEVYSVFIGANVLDQTGLKQYMKEVLPEDLKTNVYYAAESDSMYGSMFTGYGQYSDLVFLSKTKAEKVDLPNYLPVTGLNLTDKTNVFQGYGISTLVESKNVWEKYIQYLTDETYYVFINKNSVHTKELKEGGQTLQTKRLLTNLRLLKEDTI